MTSVFVNVWSSSNKPLGALVHSGRIYYTFKLISIVWMPDEIDAKKILTASLFENWRKPPGCSRSTWMKTIQQDLKSNNLSLNEAIDMVVKIVHFGDWCSTRTFWSSLPVLQGKAVKIFLASVSRGIRTLWSNREKRRDWTIAARCNCLVVHLISSFFTSWYYFIFNSFCKHHWSRASILFIHGAVIAIFSLLYTVLAGPLCMW